jgi:hypothetical protein
MDSLGVMQGGSLEVWSGFVEQEAAEAEQLPQRGTKIMGHGIQHGLQLRDGST